VKHKLILFVGVLAGLFASDYVMGAIGIEQAPGFGVDDIVRAAVIAAVVLLVDSVV
jgi:hypothetical protein